MKKGRKNRDKKGRKIQLDGLLYFLSAVLFIEAGMLAFHLYRKDRQQEERFQQLREVEQGLKDHSSKPGEDNGETGGASASHPSYKGQPDNPDWIGWLEIPDTSVSYPVMQKNGDWQYLHRDFDGNYSFYGTPFLDWRYSPDSNNLIIYGHNINGRRLFGVLHAYADKDYYKAHPQVNLRFGDETHSFQVLSVIQTDTRTAVYSFTDTGNMEEYRDDVKEILSGSLYRTEMAENVKIKMEQLPEEEFFKHFQFLTCPPAAAGWGGISGCW